MRDILEVIVYMPDYHYSDCYLFASEEALIEWWKENGNSEAKNLRVKWVNGRGTLLNWTTPQLPFYSHLAKRMVKA